jgi:hypothetical protein
MSKSLPLYPATAAALSLGTSIALAGLPVYLISERKIILDGFNNSWLTAFVFIILLAAVVILFFAMSKKYFQKV